VHKKTSILNSEQETLREPQPHLETHSPTHFMLCGSLSPWHGASLCCGWRRRLPDMEGSCGYID